MFITCRQLTEMITDEGEGKLSPVQRLGYRFHLSWCSHCRIYVDQMLTTVETLKALPEEPVPEATQAELLAQFRKHHTP
ncbi:anti-sigma factor family protein [Chondromyces crocatus]|uniref:Anti-sigma factor n=1 Tax=Chondromyces crocatus TaxID=52 RepID=A0A0K1ENS3_CHOCO|nr:zf-HC2 domain-containing protein [Chondromyces crocatus]AKT42474.1 anti-sigma factor [Chondromyces crocatus]